MSISAKHPSVTVFRILADVSHTASKIILIWAIHSNRSAEGVSLLTQILYVLVFTTRYADLLWDDADADWLAIWNTCLKVFYLASSAYIVFLMMRVFARTREKEYAWKLGAWSLLGSLIAAPVVTYFFEPWGYFAFFEILWTFSLVLESICILPQLLLLRQTSVPTVFDSYYLVALGSYRAFYVLNWLVNMFASKRRSDLGISIVFGILQTALYLDFAWVYYSRQRVKLRGGGIVDSDDLSKSFIVKRFIGRRRNANSSDEDVADEDEALAGQENGVIRPSARSWGPRGISVSADDTLPDHEGASDAQMMDPSHFEDDHDEDDHDEVDAPPPPAKDVPSKSSQPSSRSANGVESSATQWQDDGSSK